MAKGNVLRVERRFEDAIAEFERALALDPNLAEAYGTLGHTEFEMGQYQEAIEFFDKAMRLSPQNQDSAFWYGGKGGAYFGLQQYDQAIEWARWAIAINPNFDPPLFILAAALALTGHDAEARDAEQLENGLLRTHSKRGIVWLVEGSALMVVRGSKKGESRGNTRKRRCQADPAIPRNGGILPTRIITKDFPPALPPRELIKYAQDYFHDEALHLQKMLALVRARVDITAPEDIAANEQLSREIVALKHEIREASAAGIRFDPLDGVTGRLAATVVKAVRRSRPSN
jgi:tetratricopeptide (TPR) repeat protein